MIPRLLLPLIIVSALSNPTTAQTGRAVDKYNLARGAPAIAGYDPVAYFDVGGGEAKKGRADLSHEHAGVTYRFASEANREAFVAAPERFEPTYGGWCAYAMSKDKRIAVDPLAFRVARGRLFLFVDSEYLEVDESWVENEAKNIAAADKYWKAHSGESARTPSSESWRPYEQYNLSGASLAIAGYDPVSYFAEGGAKPTQGDKKYTARHRGVLYRFASTKNRDLFLKDPARYEPAHGGWCSYAMGAKGEKVEVDPEAFRMTGGKLHLFYNSWLSDTRDDWDDDTDALKRKADAAWDKLIAKAAKGP